MSDAEGHQPKRVILPDGVVEPFPACYLVERARPEPSFR